MFVLLLFAYVVFATNWVAGSNLSKQITHYYFNGKEVSPIISEVVNYTITIARIISNLLAAYILIKLNPRKAVIFALICLSFSFVAIFSPNYWLYTFARMIMAFGGSMIIVFINTFVAKFVSKDKRIITSALTTAAYNFGAALVAILFYIFKDMFISNWRYTMIGFSIFSIVLLVTWTIIAEDFKPTVTWKTPNYFVQKLYLESLENSSTTKSNKSYTYKDAFKDKFIYFFALGFGGFLFLYVMPLVSLPNKVAQAVGGNFKPEFMILSVTLGGIIGTIVSMFFSKLRFRRKPFLIAHGILMISSMFIGLQVVYYNPNLAYSLFAISGFFMYSQYPVYLNYPYELPEVSSQKLTIMFGVFWAFGYAIYTIFNFLWSIILQNYGYNTSIMFYILASCSYVIFIFTFPETMKKINKKKSEV
ncbi:MFS transporter [Gemella sp. GH3]|nr:MFS transporter [Gemella sp. GH3.1]NYS51173.1 MFS transporter [Gemella sp. GH3]